MMTYDERQTKACKAVYDRIKALRFYLDELENCIGSDKSIEILDEIKSNASLMFDTNLAININKI
jgi:hypothetical protein